jgi:hypothetical protein
MAKTSKMVANRLSVSRTVHSSVATHGDDLAETLTAVLFPDGPPAKLTMARVLTAVGGVLTRADKAVAAADLAHVTELSDDDEYRRQRDEAATTVREQLASIRDLLGGTFGKETLSAYALGEALPDNPQQLLGRAAATAKLLRTRPLTEKPRYAGVTVQPKLLADDLLAAQASLQAALDATKREEREAQLTLEGKNRAAESWQQVYPAVSNALYGLYLLAGRKDLAERITPTARRRAGLPEEGDAPSAEGEEPGQAG